MKQHINGQTDRVSPARIFSRSTDGDHWVGSKQESALEHLASRARVKVLVGPPSSGKSSVLRLFEQRSEDTVLLPLTGPKQTAFGVLATLIASANLDFWSLSETDQRNLLTVFMEHRSLRGKRIVICLDNISDLSIEAWNEIDRLTRLRVDARPIVELVIAASENELARAPLNRFLLGCATSPIEAIHFLPAPTEQDLASYISWRLARFDVNCDFSSEACTEITRWSRGRFDSVNVICQVLLWDRSLEQAPLIDKQAVAEGISKLAELKKSRVGSSTKKPSGVRSDGGKNGLDAAGRLIVLQNGKMHGELPLGETIRVGRDASNHIRLNSRLISRQHAMIVRGAKGRYFIVDSSSKNGTLVNGAFVDSVALGDGDVIDICEFRILVKLYDAVTAAEEPDSPTEFDTDGTDVMPAPDPEFARMRVAQS